MKRFITKILLGALLITSYTSCSDFFNNEPDNIETLDNVFAHREGTLKFLSNIYSYIRPPYRWSNETLWAGVSDEIDVTYADYEISKINLGMLAPDREGLYYGNLWSHYYPGIRAATLFMNRVNENVELSQEEIDQYHDEARALRAWFYFCLIRQYGPVPILSDQLIDGDATVEEMNMSRATISTCFNYVINELTEVIENGKLLNSNASMSNLDYGRFTKLTCMAIRARALLYAASDLYNRDKTTPLFRELKNNDGTYLMDYTNNGATERWQKAADAALEIITTSGLQLHYSKNRDAYESYREVFMEDWNDEIIYAIPDGSFWEMDLASTPHGFNGWNGWGVTQEMVDAYFMANGEAPILGYNADGSPIINPKSGYSESGFSTSSGDNGHTESGTYLMYCGREPRFYASITFENMKWISKVNHSGEKVHFYYGGNAGRTLTETRNYCQTGYLCAKFLNPNTNVATGNNDPHAAVVFRLGEVYLNYVEALNEVNYTTNLSTILFYLNQIRERAGIPGYGEQGLAVPANQEEMREAIRRERRVELAFEEARYFDCCRWAIAHKYFDGPKHGMNVNDPAGESAFFKRTVFETRIFPERNILWPIPLSDIYKASKLVQNPDWSTVSSTDMEE